MKENIKLSTKKIVNSIQANDFETSETDVIKRIDYLNQFLEDRRKHLEGKYMGCEEEYAIGDVINLLDFIKNAFENNNN